MSTRKQYWAAIRRRQVEQIAEMVDASGGTQDDFNREVAKLTAFNDQGIRSTVLEVICHMAEAPLPTFDRIVTRILVTFCISSGYQKRLKEGTIKPIRCGDRVITWCSAGYFVAIRIDEFHGEWTYENRHKFVVTADDEGACRVPGYRGHSRLCNVIAGGLFFLADKVTGRRYWMRTDATGEHHYYDNGRSYEYVSRVEPAMMA